MDAPWRHPNSRAAGAESRAPASTHCARRRARLPEQHRRRQQHDGRGFLLHTALDGPQNPMSTADGTTDVFLRREADLTHGLARQYSPRHRVPQLHGAETADRANMRRQSAPAAACNRFLPDGTQPVILYNLLGRVNQDITPIADFVVLYCVSRSTGQDIPRLITSYLKENTSACSAPGMSAFALLPCFLIASSGTAPETPNCSRVARHYPPSYKGAELRLVSPYTIARQCSACRRQQGKPPAPKLDPESD